MKVFTWIQTDFLGYSTCNEWRMRQYRPHQSLQGLIKRAIIIRSTKLVQLRMLLMVHCGSNTSPFASPSLFCLHREVKNRQSMFIVCDSLHHTFCVLVSPHDNKTLCMSSQVQTSIKKMYKDSMMSNAFEGKWGKIMKKHDAQLSIKTMLKLKLSDTKEVCLDRKLWGIDLKLKKN